MAAALLRELEAGPSVLVLDDVHWADEATLDVIRLAGRRVGDVPALLVLSYRDDGLDRSHPLRIVLGDLPGSDRVTRLALAGLSAQAVAELAGPEGVDAGDLHRWTAGNPFYVTEVLAAGSGLVPHSVRDAVLARAARLDGTAREVLDAAAVVPGPCELWLLDALAPTAAEALDECLGSGMAVLADGRVEFRHEIARQVVEESLPPGRRAGLHRAALAALAGQPVQDLARLAHHAEAAGDAGAMLRFAPAAAELAAAAGARQEAVGLYTRALRFASGLEPAGRAGLLERFAELTLYTGGMGEEGGGAARGGGDPPRPGGPAPSGRRAAPAWHPARGERRPSRGNSGASGGRDSAGAGSGWPGARARTTRWQRCWGCSTTMRASGGEKGRSIWPNGSDAWTLSRTR